jgi:hypothetical protein
MTFPGIAGRFRKTSNFDENYNCLCWALGRTDTFLTPAADIPPYSWPDGIPAEWSTSAIREIFVRAGYTEETDSIELEDGWEKVAFYVENVDTPTHFARQLPNGRWTSKLGMHIDVEHDDLNCLEGPRYGRLGLILKRRRQSQDRA